MKDDAFDKKKNERGKKEGEERMKIYSNTYELISRGRGTLRGS